ncbi:4-carboxymuconolactone decarboxylase [Vibrio zhanjiangensis]|jgi:4-carboxymuconolactone decarboxylase|uniref:4-carboxymuconolactone decarboxylase n=1 Tax=Vibrio zhanjiangensis TaxID=1046128 RepID=A0ABQ6F2W8_9VIBR|nr:MULTISPECIES: carboxymuconolactone decarboxylase family protein [Vibrio]MDC5849298.1 carboxymuconolactone decarboxylase family protein [Vibrio europaeus]GLT19047.1 4-carboxymuconolactone decarboxylase [Vibrio zhanjiangensis]
MMSDKQTTIKGMHVMDRLEDGLAERVSRRLSELDSDLPRLITDYAFGSVVARPGLDLKTREMLTVASLISLGNATPQLELHMKAAINVGVSPEELLEVVIQMAVYAGVPACMNGLASYRKIMNEKGLVLPGLKEEVA